MQVRNREQQSAGRGGRLNVKDMSKEKNTIGGDLDKVLRGCIFEGPVYHGGCLDFTIRNIEDKFKKRH